MTVKKNANTGLERGYVERDAAPEWQKVADRSVSGEAAAQERRKQQAIGDDAVAVVFPKGKKKP
jgi:hypothetical protein